MTIKKHIPNFITLLNLASGCVAIILLSQYDYQTAPRNIEYAFYFVCLGIFLDFFDGFFARLFNVTGELGLQLDSLADMVTSGVAPGFAMYLLLADAENVAEFGSFFPFLGFIITLGSAYRLAKFNIDTRQTTSFIGLPTPANALFIMSLLVIKLTSDSLIVLEILINPYFLLVVTALSAYMLNAEIPLFSLKVKSPSFAKNKLQTLFLLFSAALILLLGFAGVPIVILSYVALSVILNKSKRADV